MADTGGVRHRLGDLPVVLWGVAALAVATFAIGFLAAPTTYDSLTYHLPRVVHWIDNQSLNFYPTPINRQLFQPPLAEYGILQTFLATGGDRLAFLPQWLAMLGCCGGVWAITRRLGGDKQAAALAVVFCATNPMGVLQASTTQNDYVLALWVILLVWAVLDRQIVYVGFAAGLAVLTKGTGYLYALPVLIWFVVRERRLKPLFVAGLLIAVLNAPFWVRNLQAFGSPLGPRVDTYTNEEYSPRVLLSNLARNVGLHVNVPGIGALHDLLGIDLDDPRSTFNHTHYEVFLFTTSEDTAGSPFHLILLIPALAWALWKRQPPAFILVGMVLLFCAYLKWQPWHARQHLTLFVVGAPLVGLLWGRLSNRMRRRKIDRWLAGFLLITALPFVLVKPLSGILALPREQQYPAVLSDAVVQEACDGQIRGDSPEYLRYVACPDARGIRPK